MAIRVISFDMDGTLVNFNFNNAFFQGAVPRLYAKKNEISLKEAEKIVAAEYAKIKMDDKRWYLPRYWLDKFGIDGFEYIIKDIRGKIRVYPDAMPAIRTLSKKYRLIVISTSTNEFLEIKLDAENMKKYFSKYYSSLEITDGPKTEKFYRFVIKDLGIKSNELVHVGDDPKYDYLVPSGMGIRSFNVRRGDTPSHVDFGDAPGKVPAENVIKDLSELVKKLDDETGR